MRCRNQRRRCPWGAHTGLATLLLLSVAACGVLQPPPRIPGPEVIEREWEEEIAADGPLTLTITGKPSGPPGHIRGQVSRACHVVRHQEVRRTDQIGGHRRRNTIYLLAGLAAAGVGAALLSTAPDAPDPTRRAAGGAFVLAPGLVLAGAGTIGTVRSRKRSITEGYTTTTPGVSSCEVRPVEGATIFVSAPALHLARSPFAVTAKDGTFEFALLGPRKGLLQFRKIRVMK